MRPAPLKPAQLLPAALSDARALAAWDLHHWDLLLRQARQADLLASLYLLLEEQDVLSDVPVQARRHLEWAGQKARQHTQSVLREVSLIQKALQETGLPLILLKGAAYVVAGLPAARGRIFSDVDILVPKDKVNQVEAALMLHGWSASHHDDYDQRYYRNWMHELPPMQHIRRLTVIDVHHAILPLTAPLHPDPQKLLGATVPAAQAPAIRVLAPVDMVLHSAVHLFHDGEYDHGLRDLFDIHRLLRHFGAQPGFWSSLTARADELELSRPLFYALRYSRLLLHTEIPGTVLQQAQAGHPGALLSRLMDFLFLRALLPKHPSCDDRFTAVARFLLYLRANWLRMPPMLLARHLFHKAFLSPKLQTE